jgi:hypothetical protein
MKTSGVSHMIIKNLRLFKEEFKPESIEVLFSAMVNLLSFVGVHAVYFKVKALAFSFRTVQLLPGCLSHSVYRCIFLKDIVNFREKHQFDTKSSTKAAAMNAISIQSDEVMTGPDRPCDTPAEMPCTWECRSPSQWNAQVRICSQPFFQAQFYSSVT